jgi:putative membrane protein
MTDKILILSVDRDDDVGNKTGFKGPFIGKKEVLEVAVAMGLSDPEDSDFNALFQAVKVYDELKKKYKVEVAVLTGHKNVGLTSDKIISKQLDTVVGKFNADYAILVTDGSEDEHVMPIIQAKVPIMSVRRVIVKQSEQLESTYYKIKDFLTEASDNPKFARLLFGLPAMVLLLFALFGVEGFRIILGVVGAYLFVKGFKLEDYIYGGVEELRTSLTRRRFAFFAYIVSLAFAALGTYRGYSVMQEWVNVGIFEVISSFISASVFLYFVSLSMLWIGRNISTKTRRIRNIVSVNVFGFAVSLVIYNASELILQPDISMYNFILSVVFGFALIFLALLIEWKT